MVAPGSAVAGTDEYRGRMSTAETIEQLAARRHTAMHDLDEAALREIYSPELVVWHNFDQVEQPLQDSLKMMHWFRKRVPDVRYDDLRRHIIPGGFVEQYVVRGTTPEGSTLEMPACIVGTVVDDRITRLEEYLDPSHAAALSRR
jgi:hypothetical protein